MQTTLNREEKKIVSLAALGGMLEFYDFIIYGIFSVYFAHQFFPSSNEYLSIIQSYGVFVLGYLARPIGGIIFSHIGDEYGRKKVLIITVTLMGIASLGIGLLPTYSHINIAAPILLLLLRLLQGLALGGELPSTYVYISETILTKQGLSFGIVMAGVNAGLLLGMSINQILNSILTPEQIQIYGWRIPFIFGGILCLISYQIRKMLQETPSFQKIHDKPSFPLFYLFKNHFLQVLAGIASTSVMSGLVVVTVVFMPTYLREMLHLDSKTISNNMLIVIFINVVSIYLIGLLAQKTKPHIILRSVLILSVIFIPFCYWLMKENHYLIYGLIILGILEGGAAMITPLFLTYLFPTKIRLTGVALCYNISQTLFGGMSPVMITYFIKNGANVYFTPVFYLLIITLICAAGVTYAVKNNSALRRNSSHSHSN